MLLEVNKSEEARLLELDGFNRHGEKAVIAQTFESAHSVLDREDVTVRKIVIERENGDEEGALIDDYLQTGLAGSHTLHSPRVKRLSTNKDDILKTESRRKRVKIKENKIVAKDRFRSVLNGTFRPEPSTEDVHKTLKKAQERIDDAIADHQERIEELRSMWDEIEQMSHGEFVEEYC
jgi:hypothetical protein